MKKHLQKIASVALMLFIFQITLTAQPVGSQIKVGTDSHISYWNGVDSWIVIAPGLPGQDLKFIAGVPTWVNNPQGITTTAATSISGTTAVSGGNIISDGGATITARGVCWSTLPNPSISNTHTTDGTGVGSFISNITGLTTGATYYIRAYATNSFGTAYGDVLSFMPNLVVGEFYQGGIIAYILQQGDQGYNPNVTHGIIAAPIDQGVAEWGCHNTVAICTSPTIGSGAANTNAIISDCNSAGIAAKICSDLVLNGYDDWYLPSINELEYLDYNLARHGLGNFANYIYWSSSVPNCATWAADGHYFTTGLSTYLYKSDLNNVRAVRSF